MNFIIYRTPTAQDPVRITFKMLDLGPQKIEFGYETLLAGREKNFRMVSVGNTNNQVASKETWKFFCGFFNTVFCRMH